MKWILILISSLLIYSSIWALGSKDVEDYITNWDDTLPYDTLITNVTNKINEVELSSDKALLYGVRASIYNQHGYIDKSVKDLKLVVKLTDNEAVRESASNRIVTEPILHKYRDINLSNYEYKVSKIKKDDDIAGILYNPLKEATFTSNFPAAKKIFDVYKSINKSSYSMMDYSFMISFLDYASNHFDADTNKPTTALDAVSYIDSLNCQINDINKYKFLKADTYYKNDMYEDVINYIETMPEKDLKDAPGLFHIYGSSLGVKGRYDESEINLKKSVENTSLYGGRGSNNIYYEQSIKTLEENSKLREEYTSANEPIDNSKKK